MSKLFDTDGILLKKLNLKKKKSADDKKSMKNYPVGKELRNPVIGKNREMCIIHININPLPHMLYLEHCIIFYK